MPGQVTDPMTARDEIDVPYRAGLRDDFAVAALRALATPHMTHGTEGRQKIAERCWDIADDLMAERARRYR